MTDIIKWGGSASGKICYDVALGLGQACNCLGFLVTISFDGYTGAMSGVVDDCWVAILHLSSTPDGINTEFPAFISQPGAAIEDIIIETVDSGASHVVMSGVYDSDTATSITFKCDTLEYDSVAVTEAYMCDKGGVLAPVGSGVDASAYATYCFAWPTATPAKCTVFVGSYGSMPFDYTYPVKKALKSINSPLWPRIAATVESYDGWSLGGARATYENPWPYSEEILISGGQSAASGSSVAIARSNIKWGKNYEVRIEFYVESQPAGLRTGTQWKSTDADYAQEIVTDVASGAVIQDIPYTGNVNTLALYR